MIRPDWDKNTSVTPELIEEINALGTIEEKKAKLLSSIREVHPDKLVSNKREDIRLLAIRREIQNCTSIKLFERMMWNMLLSGENHKVIGAKEYF